jgi:hypothetical protein
MESYSQILLMGREVVAVTNGRLDFQSQKHGLAIVAQGAAYRRNGLYRQWYDRLVIHRVHWSL